MNIETRKVGLFLVIFVTAIVGFYGLFGILWLALLISIPWSAAAVQLIDTYFTRKG